MNKEYLKSLIDEVSAIEVQNETQQIAKYELVEYVEELQDRIDKAIEVIDTQMKLAEDEAKDNLRIIKFYLIKGSCSVYDLTTEEDYKYKKGDNDEC